MRYRLRAAAVKGRINRSTVMVFASAPTYVPGIDSLVYADHILTCTSLSDSRMASWMTSRVSLPCVHLLVWDFTLTIVSGAFCCPICHR